MLTLTDSAAQQLRTMFEGRNDEENALRIYVKPGGCTGFSYGMALDSAKDDDLLFEMKGIQVVVDKDSMELIDESEVDYLDDLTGQGFKINNPKATSMCGCGSSFRTADKAGQPGSFD